MNIKKIVFDIDGKEVELNEAQAIKLRDEINHIFGPRIVSIKWGELRPCKEFSAPSVDDLRGTDENEKRARKH